MRWIASTPQIEFEKQACWFLFVLSTKIQAKHNGIHDVPLIYWARTLPHEIPRSQWLADFHRCLTIRSLHDITFVSIMRKRELGARPIRRHDHVHLLRLEAVITKRKSKNKKSRKRCAIPRKKRCNKFKVRSSKSRVGIVVKEEVEDQDLRCKDQEHDVLAEARKIWNLGKSLGLYTEEEDGLI